MPKHLITAAAVAVLSVGSLVSVAAQAAPTHHSRTIRHAIHHSSDITSFSSSSVVGAAPASLNVGVNHPPKK